ncbi:hypothetical protein [Aliivibrio fischeri]|uniref:hypothetical protein n=1 Tax=Aliivibrio fischeri TaxID=668 RepID=UPI0007C4FE05|nr:hypothetical protein [Aliivibrio fischeri]
MVDLCKPCKGKGFTEGINLKMRLDCHICEGLGYVGDIKDIAMLFRKTLMTRKETIKQLSINCHNLQEEMKLLTSLCPEYEKRKQDHLNDIFVDKMNSKID